MLETEELFLGAARVASILWPLVSTSADEDSDGVAWTVLGVPELAVAWPVFVGGTDTSVVSSPQHLESGFPMIPYELYVVPCIYTTYRPLLMLVWVHF